MTNTIFFKLFSFVVGWGSWTAMSCSRKAAARYSTRSWRWVNSRPNNGKRCWTENFGHALRPTSSTASTCPQLLARTTLVLSTPPLTSSWRSGPIVSCLSGVSKLVGKRWEKAFLTLLRSPRLPRTTTPSSTVWSKLSLKKRVVVTVGKTK